jgi:hypothetical protein
MPASRVRRAQRAQQGPDVSYGAKTVGLFSQSAAWPGEFNLIEVIAGNHFASNGSL